MKVSRESSTQLSKHSQFGGGLKQCKKQAYSEIQNVENYGNFCKVVQVPLKLVPVLRLKNKPVKNWYRYHTHWYRYSLRKKVAEAIWYRYQLRKNRQCTFGIGTTLTGTGTVVRAWVFEEPFSPIFESFHILPHPPNSYIREALT